ncbi:unnamed protein product, partial [Allacma fusca]
ILQDIWREGLAFDVPVNDVYHERWRLWIEEVNVMIKSFQSPRCYFTGSPDYARKCLHIFCDASEKAMSVAAYITFEVTGEINTAFAMGKSKVAPLAAKSIPRLELEAAVMASRMAHTIRQQHDYQFAETHFWRNSGIFRRHSMALDTY